MAFSFDKMTKLVKEISMRLQYKMCQNKTNAQEQKLENKFYTEKEFFFQKIDQQKPIILEQKTAAVIWENKKNYFPKYQEKNLPQTPEETKSKNKKSVEGYLRLASDYSSEDFKATENIDKENYVHLISSAAEIIKNDFFVDDKLTFEEWFIGDEFFDQDLLVIDEKRWILFLIMFLFENVSKKLE